MKIVYAALDQQVPDTKGGSIHVRAVAEGLGRLGHEVHVLAGAGPDGFPQSAGTPPGAPGSGVHWHEMRPPLGRAQLRWMRAGRVLRLARAVRADAILERYYNFGGEGIRAAVALGVAGVLEVNAPVVDYPGSPKRRLDRALLVEPMRRWRDWQCRSARLIVTPSAAVLPPFVDPARVLEVEWGADTDRFRPDVSGPVAFTRQPGEVVAVFAGAFRNWHGAVRLVEAIRLLRARGEQRVRGLLVGTGPEFDRVARAAAGVEGVTLTGAVAHEVMPAYLAAADIGVAPFDIAAHAPLALGFYWSPLKIFEYMSAGLPVVAPRIPRLERLVRDGCEGVLYDTSEPGALAASLERLLDAPLRDRLGRAARARAVAEFSWAAHCAKLDQALRKACPCAC